jgi:hypothetical protein
MFLLETGDTGLRVDIVPAAGREDEDRAGADLSLPLNQPISLYVLLHKTNRVLLHEQNKVIERSPSQNEFEIEVLVHDRLESDCVRVDF